MSDPHDATTGERNADREDAGTSTRRRPSLLDRLKVRDDEAFARELEGCEGRTRRLIAAFVRDPDDAKDVYSDAVLIAYEKRWQFVFGGGCFAAWLQRIVMYKVREYHRRQWARREVADLETSQDHATSPSHEEAVVVQEDSAQLALAFSELPVTQFVVLQMFYVQGTSTGEIAAALGIAENAVCKRLERGRSLLRKRLARKGVYESLSEEGRLALADALSADQGQHRSVPLRLKKEGDST